MSVKIDTLPPPELRFRVAGTNDAEAFNKSGERSLQDLHRALAAIGRRLDEFTNILDWGCGCGRILRHFPKQPNQTVHGCDIDREAVQWVEDNLPWAQAHHVGVLPPLPYADGTFDLIFNHSVLTHLDETYQNAWLAELRRIAKPNAVLTLTAHGDYATQCHFNGLSQERAASAAQELEQRGIYYTKEDHWSDMFPDFYHSTFHHPSYIFKHWSKYFELRAYIPRGALDFQDMIVLQNRARR